MYLPGSESENAKVPSAFVFVSAEWAASFPSSLTAVSPTASPAGLRTTPSNSDSAPLRQRQGSALAQSQSPSQAQQHPRDDEVHREKSRPRISYRSNEASFRDSSPRHLEMELFFLACEQVQLVVFGHDGLQWKGAQESAGILRMRA